MTSKVIVITQENIEYWQSKTGRQLHIGSKINHLYIPSTITIEELLDDIDKNTRQNENSLITL